MASEVFNARESKVNTVNAVRQGSIDFEGANGLFNRLTNRSERMNDSRFASNYAERLRAAEERWRRNNPNF